MFNQRLPRVKEEIFLSLSASMTGSNNAEVQEWVSKLFDENPHLVLAVDSLGTSGGLLVAAMVYKLLDSQAEADEMNEAL